MLTTPSRHVDVEIDRRGDEKKHGGEEVHEPRPLGNVRGFAGFDVDLLRAGRRENAGLGCAFFGAFHRPENGNDAEDDERYDRGCEPSIKVIGDRLQEIDETFALRGEAVRFEQPPDEHTPGRDRDQHAYGRGGGVDDISEHLARDFVAVGDGRHRRSHRERVEIVVDENSHPEDPRPENGALSGLRPS